MVLLRRLLGDELRRQRLHQQRTLREVSSAARVSLGYLSEVERGQKEASSELLSSICAALEVPLSVVLRGVSARAGPRRARLRPCAGHGSGPAARCAASGRGRAGPDRHRAGPDRRRRLRGLTRRSPSRRAARDHVVVRTPAD